MKIGKLLFLCFILITSAVKSIAQTVDATKIEGEDREIQKLLEDNNVPLLGLGFVQNGKLEKVKIFSGSKKSVPALLNPIFNVASLTKPVVSILTLRLVSAGKWSLDESLDKYWIDPDIESDPRHKMLTTRLILTNRTGFPNWRWMSKSKKLSFEFDPGSKYQYSGEGFEYLRRALESKFKLPLETMAAELLFDPLGMKETRFVWDNQINESRFAVGFDQRGNAYPVEKSNQANAADDLLTTVENYGKFVVSVLHGEGMSKDVFAEMINHQVKIKENKYFGLGWGIYDNLSPSGEYALSHSGSDKGVSTQVFLLPKSKQALIVLMNVDEGYKIYDKILIKYFGELGRKIVEIEMKRL